jgi:nicotinate-nucleotide adenylyltransferase
MRLGVFGGTFDPVHAGHLLLADCCWRQARLDRVLFVPAARQPHKAHAPVAADGHRVEMLRLALRERPEFETSTVEIDRGGMSYTVDTLGDIQRREPAAELFFLMGADALADLPNWRRPEEICALAAPLVVRRAGSEPPDYDALATFLPAERVAEIRALEVEMPPTPISSSHIRRLIAEGGEWQSLVPPAAAEYIAETGLYGAR